ncbi:hypothetical protein [Leeuwenhoekiella sp. NPDC079379]|uniref:hypothetical protein n=1 Tax=Leeuwenhoekiella sp. NPDC079379 TaxID=3364122 RepID=UPI0037C5252D
MLESSKNDYKSLRNIVYIAIVFAVVSCITILYTSLFTARLVRILYATVLIGFYFIRFKQRKKTFQLALVFFWMRDVSGIYYEASLGVFFYFGLGTIAYLLLFFKQLKNLMRLKFEAPSIVATGLFTLACFIILFNLKYLLGDASEGSSVIYYFYFLGTSIIVLILLSFYYYYRMGSLRALIFSFAIFSLMISDVSSYFGYYLGVSPLFLITGVFYIIALVLLINFLARPSLISEENRIENDLI